MSGNAPSFDTTVNVSGPLSGQNLTGTVGYDLISFASFTTDLIVDLTTGVAEESGNVNTATFSDFEAVRTGSGMDAIRWGLTSDAIANPGYFDGGASNFDVFRIADITLGAGQEVQGVDLTAGCVFGVDGANAVDFAILENLEWLTIDADGDFDITGTDGVNVLTMRGTGNDTIMGLGGDDQISGGAGDDIIDGGEGEDSALYLEATSGVTVYLKFDGRDVGGGMGADEFIDIENLFGSNFNDRLVGDENNNELLGFEGNDVLKGKGGNDVLAGYEGDDRLFTGAGNDLLSGGEGSDILIGLAGVDNLSGGDDRDFVYGGRDNDTARGGAGDDEVRGNLGNDTLFGDAGADDLRGGGGNDIMEGGLDNDFLFGENGADILFGGEGNDVMTGGKGAGELDGTKDTFVFAAGGAFDRIKDFEDGIDVLGLNSFGFTDFTTEVLTLASDTATGMRIDFGGGDILFLEGFAVADFDASDVVL